MTWKRWAASIAAGGLVIVMGATAALAGEHIERGQWPTFRGDNARTGRAQRGISEEPVVVWRAKLGGSVDGSPIVVGGRVYVGNNEGILACLALADGKLLWRQELDGAIASAAAAADGRVVVGTAKGFVYCLAMDGGEVLWRVHCWDAVVASPLVIGGKCLVGSMDGVFHALDMGDGREVWSRELSGGISAAACSDGRRVFVADEGGSVWCLQADDGEVVWRKQTGCPATAAPVYERPVGLIVPLVSPTRLAPPKVPFLQVMDPGSGDVRWQVVEARSIFASPLLGPAGVVYISVEGYLSATLLRCRSADGRRAVYKRRIGGVVDSSPAMAAETAYFGAHDGCVYAVSLRTGQVLWRVELAPKIFSSPALVDGRLVIGASDGRVYCLR